MSVALAINAGGDSMMLAVCIVVAIGLVAYTFYVPADYEHGKKKTRVAFLKERKEQVYENLRDLNFEYKAGKLPEADYEQMRASLEDEAAALLAEIERLEATQAGLDALSAARKGATPAVYKGISNRSTGARS